MPDPIDRNLSFRALLSGEIGDFLKDEGLDCSKTSASIVAIASRLTALREEGLPLSPEVYFCTDLQKLAAVLQGGHVISLGSGPLSEETCITALKECAPLAHGGWVIYFERINGLFKYGVLRASNLPLSITVYEALIEDEISDVTTISIKRVAENCVEVRGGKGNRRCLYFSDQRQESLTPDKAVNDFCTSVTHDVPVEIRDETLRFLYRNISQILNASHGTILVVQSKRRRKVLTFLRDCVELPKPLSISSLVEDYKTHRDDESLASLNSAIALLDGMVNSDGILVFRSDAAVLAYRAFLALPAINGVGATGGARRRTFEALKANLGQVREAALIRSHDGQTEFWENRNEQP